MAKIDGGRFGESRLGVAFHLCADSGESLLDAIEEDIAPRLGNVEQADGKTVERLGASDQFSVLSFQLASGIQDDGVRRRAHRVISFVTVTLPVAPATHPANVIENSPALLPAWTT